MDDLELFAVSCEHTRHSELLCLFSVSCDTDEMQ